MAGGKCTSHDVCVVGIAMSLLCFVLVGIEVETSKTLNCTSHLTFPPLNSVNHQLTGDKVFHYASAVNHCKKLEGRWFSGHCCLSNIYKVSLLGRGLASSYRLTL